MKRKLRLCTLLTVVVFCLATLSPAQGFLKRMSLSFSGGLGTMSVGDTNDLFDSNMDFFEALKSYYQLYGYSSTLTGEAPKLNAGIDMLTEFIVQFGFNLGVGIGIGYIQRTSEGDVTFTTNVPSYGNVVQDWVAEPKITAVPVLMTVYYFYPVMDKLNICFGAGGGIYFGKQSWEGSSTYTEPGYSFVWTDTASFTGTGFGVHGVIGAEYILNSFISFFIEGRMRSATLKGLEGDQTLSGNGFSETYTGTIWYIEERDDDLGLTQIGYEVADTKPTYSWLQNVREWEVKLSGIAALIGIKISFGGHGGE